MVVVYRLRFGLKIPVRAGYVKNEWDWVYSSASNYQDEESIIDVFKIPPMLITYSEFRRIVNPAKRLNEVKSCEAGLLYYNCTTMIF
jgi:hypothetical protein